MKAVILLLMFLSIRFVSFSQMNDSNLDKLLINKLIAEGELTTLSDKVKYQDTFYKNYFLSDSAGLSFSVIEFGITSVHGKHFFCYVSHSDTSFAKSYDVTANLVAATSFIKKSQLSVDAQLLFMEKLVGKMRFEFNRYKHSGNLPY
jgi:hypothetical protein